MCYINGMKYIAVAVSLVVVAFAFFGDFPGFAFKEKTSPALSTFLPSFQTPSLEVPTLEDIPAGVMAWSVWETYLSAAQNHDLPGVSAVSYRLSATCADPAKESDCFALMDNLYSFGAPLKRADFTHIRSDSRQIIMYTDGPDMTFLYFTRAAVTGTPKVLGLRFCDNRDLPTGEGCVDFNADTKDDNGNGWWNSVESLIYR